MRLNCQAMSSAPVWCPAYAVVDNLSRAPPAAARRVLPQPYLCGPAGLVDRQVAPHAERFPYFPLAVANLIGK
jgi:hypothetical protein